MKVVIDTNVVLSALLFSGRTSVLRNLWRAGAITPVATAEIFAEYARALTYKKFGLTGEEISAIFDTEILPFFIPVKPRMSRPLKIPTDPGDTQFVVAASVGDIQALISGDKHLLALQDVGDVPILSPGQFLLRFFPRAE